MDKLRRILGTLLVLGAVSEAQDVITLNDGDELHGRVLGYSDGHFTVLVGGQQRAFPAADVDSVALGADSVGLALPAAKAPMPKPAKPRTTPAAMLGSTAASHDSDEAVRVTISEFNARKADLVGMTLKLSFFYRDDIQSIGQGEYETTIWDDNNSMQIRFGQDAFPYVESIKTMEYRWRNQGLAKRGYYLFGKAEVHRDAFGGVRFRPIGRTKKGDDYVW